MLYFADDDELLDDTLLFPRLLLKPKWKEPGRCFAPPTMRPGRMVDVESCDIDDDDIADDDIDDDLLLLSVMPVSFLPIARPIDPIEENNPFIFGICYLYIWISSNMTNMM